MNNFKNPYFEDVFSTITSYMPLITFWGIIATYAITAALNVYFISLPPVISIPAAIAIQFGRFAIVFMDFLNPTGRKSSMPFFIAFAATIVAIFELYYSAGSFGLTEKEELSIILFGSSIIAMGFFLEVNFISKGAEAYGLGRGRPGRKAQMEQDTPSLSTSFLRRVFSHKVMNAIAAADNITERQMDQIRQWVGEGMSEAQLVKNIEGMSEQNGQKRVERAHAKAHNVPLDFSQSDAEDRPHPFQELLRNSEINSNGNGTNNGSPDTDDGSSTLDELLSIAAHNSNGNGTGE